METLCPQLPMLGSNGQKGPTMQKSYNWAMFLVVAATILLVLTVAGAAVDAISGVSGVDPAMTAN